MLCALRFCILACCLAAGGTAQAAEPASTAPAVSDGRHDFDFNLGNWRSHIRRMKNPLSGSSEWMELEGTVAVRKVWDGRAQLEEIGRLIDTGCLHAFVDKVLEQARQAFEQGLKGHSRGKIVLRIAG